MSEQDQLGVRALKLLAEGWMVAVVRVLADSPLRPAELERRLPDAGHSVLMRRLRHLLDNGLVNHEHRPGVPPHAHSTGIPHEAHYDLTQAGRTLLEVVAQAERWERTWCAHPERSDRGGTLAIKLTADRHTRKLGLLLADGPLSTTDLDVLAPDLRRSALRRRLRELVLAGLLERSKPDAAPLYELTPGARHLALVAMLAGHWEWRWSRREHPAPGRDLGALLHLLAPLAHIPEPVAGVCQLRLEARDADERDIYLVARAGNVLALPKPPAAPAEAVGRARPEAWCDTLLQRDGPIAISGNQALLTAVIGGLSTALLA